MKKHYSALLRLGCILFFTTASLDTYSKSSSIIDTNHPLYEIEWLFIKTLVEEPVYNNVANYKATFRADNPPVANCVVDFTIQLDASGNATITAEDINNGSTDDFDNDSLIFTFDENDNNVTSLDFDCDDISNHSITLYVKDSLEQISTCIVNVKVVDNIPPTLTAVADRNENLTASCNFTIPDYTTLTTANDNCATLTVTQSPAAGTVISGAGTTQIITLSTTDGTTPVNTTFVVTLVDNIPPTLTAVANRNENLTASCNFTIPDYTTLTTANDNCATLTVTQSPAAGTVISGAGTTQTITLSTTDGTTPVNTTFVVTLVDNIPPTLTAVANRNENLTASCNFTIPDYTTLTTANDNCATLTVTQSPAAGTVISGAGTTQTITLSTTDGTTPVNTTFVVTLVDNIAPMIATAPANITINCLSDVPAMTGLAWTDNCDAGGTVTGVDAALVGQTYDGYITRTWNITDANGNKAVTRTQLITIKDTTDPIRPVLNDLIAECSHTLIRPTTTDNCDGVITATTALTDLTISTIGTQTIFWKFEDAAGNSITVEQEITITDSAPTPVSSSLTAQEFEGCEIPNIEYLVPPTATDSCDGEITGTLSPDFVFPYSFNGTETIEWEFIDSAGNKTVQSQDITLNPIPVSGGTLSGTYQSTAYSEVVDISSCGEETIEVILSLTGEAGETIRHWEKYAANNKVWEVIPNTDESTTYTASFPIGGLVSTTYRALIQTGTCSAYSTEFYIRALPAGLPPTITILDTNDQYCLGEDVKLLATSQYYDTVDTAAGTAGDFGTGNPTGWLVDGKLNNFSKGGNNDKPTNWTGKGCSNNKPSGIINYCGDRDYAITHGLIGVETTLESPLIDLTNITSASLNFDQAYYFLDGDFAAIEISIDGGTTYSTLRSMHALGDGDVNWFTAGSAESVVGSTEFEHNFSTDNTVIDLSDYIGESNVRIRWSFTASHEHSSWALDDITVNTTVAVPTDVEWSAGIGNPNGDGRIRDGVTNEEFIFTPDAPGHHQYGSTTLINGCRSYDKEGTTIIDIYVSHAYVGESVTYSSDDCGQNTVQLNAYDNTKTATENAEKGAFVRPDDCVNCDDPGTQEEGVWSIYSSDNTCGVGSFSNINDPDAIFTAEAGTYTLTWTVAGCSRNIVVTTTNCATIDFDGENDYVDFGNAAFNFNDNFSIEAWVKPQSIIAGTQTIFSKRNPNNSNSGYDLSVTKGIVSFNYDGSAINSKTYKITTNRWYHIAVTFSSNSYKLYIDGVEINSAGGASPTPNNFRALLGAMENSPAAINDTKQHFNGWIDEVRIWNVGLTTDQLHQMMNQKITDNSGNVRGTTIPMTIDGLSWSNLEAYFQMESSNLTCGYLQSNSSAVIGKLKNMTSSLTQSAPLPYISKRDGDWTDTEIWVNGNIQQAPNSLGINGSPINWNIVRTNHNISATDKNITVLGLLVENNRLSIANSNPVGGQSLEVTKYLKIDGTLDLVGESQLLQPEGSIVDYTGTGVLERDQQGTGNMFNYNYWGSPVSTAGAIRARTYTLDGIMHDGDDKITWISDHTFTPTSPISISTRWLYTYKGAADNYNLWKQITPFTAVAVGNGYLMKGGGINTAPDKNYTFKGQPNNGTILVPIGGGESIVVGNPYPSAIDADEFIRNNEGTLEDGTLQFWQQSPKAATHVLSAYQGGYASYNFCGGVAPVSPPGILDVGNAMTAPGQYIPVGQGFFVYANSTGGNITFNNDQRVFVTEASGNSVFLRTPEGPSKMAQRSVNTTYVDDIQRVRLAFKTPEGATRNLLLAFTPDDDATDGIDYGYDGLIGDALPSDLLFNIEGKKFVIQGVGAFDISKKYPLDMTVGISGNVAITLTELENFDAPIDVYVHDALLDTYTKINAISFELQLEKGNYTDRFSIVFTPNATLSIIDQDFKDISVRHLQQTDEIHVKTPASIDVRQVYLINIAGQVVKSWNITNMTFGQEFKIPVRDVSEGNYIVKIETNTNSYNKKIIVKYK